MNPQGWPAGAYFGESLEYGGKSSVLQAGSQRNGQIGWLGARLELSLRSIHSRACGRDCLVGRNWRDLPQPRT